ncbi:hypothetical protein OPQ81_009096 [Rhizoctonia solani]|nr:hypothetical protein OPQ81_009096 [Rhizoctonia solani]
MEPKIQAKVSSQNPDDRHNFLNSLLSCAPADRQTDNLFKFAILLPLSSPSDADSTLDSLKFFARSLRDSSWRDRNELGAIRFDLSIYLALDIKDTFLLPSSSQTESRAELIFHQHGFFRVFNILGHQQKELPGSLLNNAARRAYSDGCDYYIIANHTTELLDEGWMRITHAKFREISVHSGGPIGFGCATFMDHTRPGIPTFPVVHHTHLDIFKGRVVPNELDVRDASAFLFQLYRHFGAATTIPSRTRSPPCIIPNETDSPLDWTFDTLEAAKSDMRVWAEQNWPNIRSYMSLDIIIPCYRVSLEALSKVLALKSGSSCITTFIIVVDNPQSPYIYELVHSNSHRADVRILVNETNHGASGSRNRGLATSTAEWVAFLDDDVTPLPNYLVAAEHYIRNQPNAAGFVGNTHFPAPHNIFTTAIQLSGVTFFWNIADKIAEDVPWGITANLLVQRNVRDKVKFDL